MHTQIILWLVAIILVTAGMAGIGATVGLVLGIAAKLSLAFAMLGTFLIVRFL